MFNPRNIFQKISYLQYPILLIGIFYIFKPIIYGFENMWEDYNYALIFYGLGISFSTLQDTTKTQNKFSRKIWENPKKGKAALVSIGLMALFFLVMGLSGIYFSESEILKQLSFGLIVLGIGVIGLLKTAVEMFENHRLDKNPESKILLAREK